jgi:hypothetical protein
VLAACDFPGIINHTGSIYGEVVSEGETLSVDFPEEVDLSKRERYAFLTGIASVADTGRMCNGRELSFFHAWNLVSSTYTDTTETTRKKTTTPSLAAAHVSL